MTVRLSASAAIAVALAGGACSQDAIREPAQCAAARECWPVTFAFMNFAGQHAQLYLDGELVLDAPLQTDNWTNALSRSVTHTVTGSTALMLSIDGAIVYEGPIAGPEVRTIYIDARSATPLEQTDHPGPLLD